MSEVIVPAKKHQCIWLLKPGPCWEHGRGLSQFLQVDVIAWAIGGNRPIPITPMGKFDVSTEYVLAKDHGGWMAIPSGQTFDSMSEVEGFLRGQ